MRYFTLDEFDSPDLPGSGAFMQQEFLDRLDEARTLPASRSVSIPAFELRTETST